MYLVEILGPIDDELQLILGEADQSADDLRLEAKLLVTEGESAPLADVRRLVTELRAEADEVALDGPEDRARRLDRDVMTRPAEVGAERHDFGDQERLASRDDDMATVERANLGQNLLD